MSAAFCASIHRSKGALLLLLLSDGVCCVRRMTLRCRYTPRIEPVWYVVPCFGQRAVYFLLYHCCGIAFVSITPPAGGDGWQTVHHSSPFLALSLGAIARLFNNAFGKKGGYIQQYSCPLEHNTSVLFCVYYPLKQQPCGGVCLHGR